MSLSVGIVGLPNVGKSTLFNALLKKQQAYAANFPFATIEPNIGVVPIPDDRLEKLAKIYNAPIVPAVVEFLDIAGLVKGAHKGEGLGNKFLAHIRETSVILHVVRNFTDENIVREGSVNPKSDLEIIETELLMADLGTLEKQREPNINAASKEEKARWQAIIDFKDATNSNKPVRKVITNDNAIYARELSMLTAKPILVAMNSDEEALKDASQIEADFASELSLNQDQIIVVNAKLEEELAGLSDEDQKTYLSDLGVTQSGLERLIKKAFATLGLITFLTAGEKEVRAWTIKVGDTAKTAAGVIHTDFEQKFIKADICKFDDFIALSGWKRAREEGKVKSEGKDYIMADGDVVEFKVGN